MKKFLLAITLSVLAIGISATPVYPPALISPTDGATDKMPDVVLNWGAVAAAISYKVQIDKDPAFNTTEFKEYTTNLTGIHSPNLSFGDMYYWRVKANGSVDTSDWSETWSFSIIDVVTLNTPTNNNGVKQMLDVTLKWIELTGINFYEYEIDTSLGFSSPALQQGTVDTAGTKGDQLRFGATYHWRVRAGHTPADVSSWCNPWSFITYTTTTITGPANGLTNRMPDVEMKWNKLTGINYYEYELTHDSLFNNAITIVTDTNVNYAEELLFGKEYYLRVRAVNDNDVSDWTDVRHFTTIGQVGLVSPANNSTNISIRPIMKWDDITGIDSYQLQYADNPAFNNAFEELFPNNQVQYQIEGDGLDSATVYYWRVRAFHTKDTTDWSDVWNFKIAATGIDDIQFDKSNINIYPNPASQSLFVGINSETPIDIHLSVMDLLGQVLISNDIQFNQGDNTKKVDLQNLNNGIYLVKLQKGSKQFVSKIVIDRR